MTEGFDFLKDLAVVMLVSGTAGWICQRVGLSSVVGFLLAGILIGPNTPPFALVSDLNRIQILSELGLVFLMFSVGMGLSLRRLRSMGLPAVAATALSAVLMFFSAQSVGQLIGWTPLQSIFLAAMLMVSSSAIITKVLREIGATHEPASRLAMGVTVMEDIVAVVMFTVLTSLTKVAGAGEAAPFKPLGLILAFVILLVIGGLLIVPRLLSRLERSAAPDLQTILLVGMVLSVALLAVKAGYSLALGAFLIGAIVAETAQRAQVERYLQGLRDIFTAVFFVSIGMSMDVALIGRSWPLVILLGVFTLVARTAASSISLVLIGHPTREAIRSGLMVTPIGEFSFIIAQLGVTAKAAPQLLYPVAVGVALFTALTSPYLIKHSQALSRGLERIEPRFLKDLVRFYHGALERIARRQQGNLVWQLSKKRLTQITLGVLFVTGLLGFGPPVFEAVFTKAGPDLPLAHLWKAAFWTVLGLIVLVPLLAIWRSLIALAAIYAEALVSNPGRELRLRGSLEAALQTLFGAAVVIWLWVLLPFDFAAIWTALGVFVLLGLTVWLLRRRLIRLHSRVEIALGEMFASGERRDAPGHEILTAPHSDWDIHLHELVLPDHAECAGQSLSTLTLRQRFGCSVAGVERHGFPIPNPAPDLVLYPGDKLLLLATPAQMQAARTFLQRTRNPDAQSFLLEEIEIKGVQVPPVSPATGSLLVELEIPATTGVQLVGIERDGQRLLNPGPFQGIDAGDRLLALGTPGQIARFEQWLHRPSGTAGGNPSAENSAP